MVATIYFPLWAAAAVFTALCIIAGWWDDLAQHWYNYRMDRSIKKHYDPVWDDRKDTDQQHGLWDDRHNYFDRL